ncbi:rhamnogalacturonan acetylesterase [Pedobacter sp. AW31-3R]|uniref:rhamnogalacturonan acetylesterase n=1 Tax=Pedobacter sp. AW31-3R TaxID=3445781 RepID=UPI003FA0E19D
MRIKRTYLSILLPVSLVVFSSFVILYQKQKPVVYLIGDSTVKNGSGKGDGALWGWGNFLAEFFDTEKISVENHALGGTSSRTFQTNGRWEPVMEKLKKGDFVIIQFGHNDGGALADTSRARGTIQGTGTESEKIFNPIKKKEEVVYTYGGYLRKYISDIRSKGAVPVICSPIPRNPAETGVVKLSTDKYGIWAEEVALAEHVDFIPLNKIINERYAQLSATEINSFFTTKDHTHTSEKGAKFNAAAVVSGIMKLRRNTLKKYIYTQTKAAQELSAEKL